MCHAKLGKPEKRPVFVIFFLSFPHPSVALSKSPQRHSLVESKARINQGELRQAAVLTCCKWALRRRTWASCCTSGWPEPAVCPGGQEGQWYPGAHWKECGQQGEEVPPFCSALMRPHLEYYVLVSAPQKRIGTRMEGPANDLGHLPYEERLRALGLFSPQKRRLRGDFIDTYQYIKFQ